MTDKERIEELERQLKEIKELHEIERFYLVNQARQFQEAQNQKAVSALEKVKKFIDNDKGDFYRDVHIICAEWLIKKIDQLISELGGNDE